MTTLRSKSKALALAYHKGFMEKDGATIEQYAGITNDLAEGIKPRCTEERLCEVLGWQTAENVRLTAKFNELKGEMILAVLHVSNRHTYPDAKD